MKKSLAVVSSSCLSFVLGGVLVGTALQVCAVSPPTATQNGDTNGDGSIDISDAVHLLSFLFTGGAEIAAIDCQSSPPQTCLLSTNSTTCHGRFGGVIDCSVPPAKGQDAFYRLGCPLDGRFVDNVDGTVADNCTGLMWTKKNIDVDGDFEVSGHDRLPWFDAISFVEDWTFAGHDDWRIPNAQELLTIFDFGHVPDPPQSAVAYFPFEFDQAWSSTPDKFNPDSQAYVFTTPQGPCVGNPLSSLGVGVIHFVVAVRSP